VFERLHFSETTLK